METIPRKIENALKSAVARDKSILLLGPRQTGKTTLLNQLSADLSISFIQPPLRLRYEQDLSQLMNEIEALQRNTTLPLVIIDEVQKVPLVMDMVQDLIDRNVAKFILTGSSARKLRRSSHVNLLPGRVIPLRMTPCIYPEIAYLNPTLENLLIEGSLPKIITLDSFAEKQEWLNAYVSIYLEEEVRSEALVRNLGQFARFLELAASVSGKIINYTKLSQEIGIAHTSIAAFYQVLEDCLIVERFEPYLKTKTHRKLTKTHKFIFFDLGVRRLAAKEGRNLPTEFMGHLFEQFIGLELLYYSRYQPQPISIHFWRDLNGPEIDWVIQTPEALIPIEVKWTTTPTMQDAKHLQTFLREYEEASKGYIVCRIPRKMKLSETIYAIPWQDIYTLI